MRQAVVIINFNDDLNEEQANEILDDYLSDFYIENEKFVHGIISYSLKKDIDKLNEIKKVLDK